ncbi:hypothetical protein CGS26_09975 [Clostridium sporogenes]|uniref:Uncharacterized protein n=1 Tax=Clostridium sporogenes TaxID=1509 RepID=A0AAE6I823_CLOSG|nr:hypothetical protein CGS26_09975 [Clostridium sporogenes]
MSPDFVMSRNDMARKLLLAFSSYEIEQEKKAEQARKGAR